MENLPFPSTNKMIYIATFFSHFGAIRFKKLCQENHISARVMPVPRNLSSSCGTCVRYESPELFPNPPYPEEMEQIVQADTEDYPVLYRAENS